MKSRIFTVGDFLLPWWAFLFFLGWSCRAYSCLSLLSLRRRTFSSLVRWTLSPEGGMDYDRTHGIIFGHLLLSMVISWTGHHGCVLTCNYEPLRPYFLSAFLLAHLLCLGRVCCFVCSCMYWVKKSAPISITNMFFFFKSTHTSQFESSLVLFSVSRCCKRNVAKVLALWLQAVQSPRCQTGPCRRSSSWWAPAWRVRIVPEWWHYCSRGWNNDSPRQRWAFTGNLSCECNTG